MSQNRRPVVIKRKKVANHGSHGGWKIAYADFMTAMMAFFLVMWLLASSSEEEFEMVNQYFQTPLRVALTGGEQISNSDSVIPGGGDSPVHSDGAISRTDLVNSRGQPGDNRALDRLKERLEVLIEEEPSLRTLRSQIRLNLTPEGLRIQIVDSQQRPMFELGSARVAPHMHNVLTSFAPLLNELPNRLTLSGHTDDIPFAAGVEGYSNWELSTDRANTARRELVQGGLDPDKLLRVIGMADTMSIEGEKNPALNRRISILVLNRRAQAEMERQNEAPGAPTIIDSDRLPTSMDAVIRNDGEESASNAEGDA